MNPNRQLDAIPNLVFVKDPAGVPTTCNSAFDVFSFLQTRTLLPKRVEGHEL
jgi:hypothetical protein